MIDRVCPICDTTEYSIKVCVDSMDEELSHCKQCGLVYLSKMIESDQFRQFSFFYVPSSFFKMTHAPFANRIREAYQDIFRIEKHIKPGNMFDVCAGGGIFLKCAEDVGWKVIGNDLSIMCGVLAKKLFNVPLINKEIEDIELKDDFDCFVMTNAIEHIRDPIKALGNMRTHLKKDGILFIRTSDQGVEDIIKNPQLPNHVCNYTKDSMEKMLQKTGFYIVEIEIVKDLGGIKTMLVIARKSND